MPSESDKWGWKHVSVFGGFDKGSGTKRWKCNHCNLRYNGSYSRVRAHLLGFTGVGVKSCPAIDRSLREAFQILEEERLVRKKKRTSGNRKPKKLIRTSQPSATCVSKAITKEDLDDIVARFFYADGLNLKAIDSPYFHELVRAIAAFGPGYEPPSVEKLSDSFLNKEKARIEKAMALVRESWPHSGCTIMYVNSFDGTLSSCCINIFVSSPRGLLFLKAIEVKDSVELENLLASVLSDAIIEIGPKNVIQIISHLGPDTESFESLMTSKFPHIFWSPCTLHSIRLLMDDIAELDWIKPIVLRAKGIEQCMLTYHQHSSSISSLTQDLKEIFDPLAAKCAPAFCVVQRIFKLKQELQVVVVSEEWKQWKLNISEDIICIEDVILGDDFWSRAYLILQLWDPFLTLLPALSIDKSIMGDVYYWRVQALGLVRSKGIDDIVLNQLEMLIEGRWDMLFSPLHAAGYILNPRYFGKGQTKDKTAMRGWKATLERYESDGTGRRVLREQLSSYWRLEGSLGEDDAIDCRDKMDPVAWWENFGFESPQLQTLAIKILSQVSSVSMCQESGQDHCFSCQKTTGRLRMDRGEDLAFVRNNLKLHRQRIGNSSPMSGQRNVTLNSLSGVRI